MAQHDYDIANADGATVRADMNALVEAIASNNSGATAPGTTFAFMWWIDTSTGLLKQRNAANTGWIMIGTLESAYLGLASLIDEDDFASNSATQAPSQQSVGAYVAAQTAGDYDGTLNLANNLVIKLATAATVDIDADRLVLFTSEGVAKGFDTVNLTVDITASGANGLDTGSEANSTWYYIWVIGKADGTVAGLLSASATAPTLPADYIYRGRVGTTYNDGSGNLLDFIQHGRFVGVPGWGAPLSAGTQTSYTAVNLSAYVPPIARATRIQGYLKTSSGSAFCSGLVASEGATTTAQYSTATLSAVVDTSGFRNLVGDIEMTTAQQIKYYVAGTNATLTLNVVGWRF